jgi:hypothetical protein
MEIDHCSSAPLLLTHSIARMLSYQDVWTGRTCLVPRPCASHLAPCVPAPCASHFPKQKNLASWHRTHLAPRAPRAPLRLPPRVVRPCNRASHGHTRPASHRAPRPWLTLRSCLTSRQLASIGRQQVDEHTLQLYISWFQMYVTYVSSGCCKSRSGIAYVVMAIHVCCKCMFQMFHLFQTYVTSVSSGCCMWQNCPIYTRSVFNTLTRTYFHLYKPGSPPSVIKDLGKFISQLRP